MSRQGGMEAGTFAKELYSLESSKETKGKNIFSSKFKCTSKQQIFANIHFINNYL